MPILCYHHVSPRAGPHVANQFWVSAERFAEQMALLAELQYRVVPLRDCAAWLDGSEKAPPRTAVVTFDDAYCNFADHAFPVLKRHGFGATVFVPTDHVGGSSRWNAGHEAPIMDWRRLREIHAAGVECASHTASHPRLPQMSEEEVMRELVQSRSVLEQRLGAPVRCLAYPFGHFNSETERAAGEAGYEFACSIVRGNVHRPGEHLRLKRVPISEHISPDRLRSRLLARYDFHCRLRRVKDRLITGMRRLFRLKQSPRPPL